MADEEEKMQDNDGGQKEAESKKEGKISGFFKKIGKKLDDATYNMRLQSEFDTTHTKYEVYRGTSVFEGSPEIAVEEHLDENYLLTLDDDEQIAEGSLLKAPNGDIIHIASVEKSTLTVEFEGKSNEMPALKIYLGEMAQEVKVIRVGDKYYLA